MRKIDKILKDKINECLQLCNDVFGDENWIDYNFMENLLSNQKYYNILGAYKKDKLIGMIIANKSEYPKL